MKIKWLYIVTLLTLLVGLIPLTTQAAPPTASIANGMDMVVEEETVPDSDRLAEGPGTNGESKYQFEAAESTPINMNEPAIYIVQLADAPAASYRGEIAGLEATNPRAKGEVKFDTQSDASIAYVSYLQDQQTQFINTLEKSVARPVEVKYQYQYVLNGMAILVTPAEAAAVATLPGVVNVERDYMLYPTTDVGPEWIGAPGIWDGTDTGGLPGTKGEGILVGVLDTGINMDHPSFAAVGPTDGYTHTNPWGTGVYTGACAISPTVYICNDKLIGAWDFVDGANESDGPEDSNGHGSHTSSTAAGNFVTATMNYSTTTLQRQISGVAPHANIIMYDVCDTSGCPGSATTAAKEQAIKDGVDVINYSIGGGGANPWTNTGALGWLSVRDAGIFVATSAGNAGPDAETIGSPGNSPWMLTVGASTHNRRFPNSLTDMTGGSSPPADIEGKGITSGYGPAEIVYAGWYTSTGSANDAMCLDPFAPGTFSGEIVVCDRGVIARVDKGANVLAGGASGLVLANTDASGESTVADGHFLPAVHIGDSDGDVVRAWLSAATVQTATISGYQLDINDSNGDIMAGFSSRGSNNTSAAASIVKPDVAAPGVSIIAAYNDGPEYNSISGTSMASPHAAGAGALIRALHPNWTPAEVQSALMMTSWTDMLKEDETTPADPFDRGAGRVDLSKAGMAGLVLDETTANFEAADPALGGDPTTLNLASLGDAHCINECVWTRVLSSTLATTETWTIATTDPTSVTLTVDPISFTLAAGATQVVTVTADVTALTLDQWAFGEVKFTPATTATVEAHFPVAVQRVFAHVPELVVIETDQYTYTETVKGLEGAEVTALTINEYGLTQATLDEEYLNEATGGLSLANNPEAGNWVLTMVVTDTDKRLVAEVITTTSPDIDLFIYLPGTGFACVSATGATLEYCSIEDPAAGTYYIIIQNYAGSAAQPDRVVLATAIVPNTDAGNMVVTGPATVPVATLFDVDIAGDIRPWQENTLGVDNYWYGAFDVGTDAGNPGNMGLVSVNLIHAPSVDFVTTVAPEITMKAPGTYTVTYETVVDNTGTEAANNVAMTYTLDADLTAVSLTSTGGTSDLATTSWSIAALAPGASYAVTLVATGTVALPLEVDTLTTQVNAYDGQLARGPWSFDTDIKVPTVDFVTPTDGQIFRSLAATSVPVEVTTTDFDIPTDGYWQLWVDGTDMGQVLTYTTATTLTLGTHVISAELRLPDDTVLGPVNTINVTVEPHTIFLPLVMKNS